MSKVFIRGQKVMGNSYIVKRCSLPRGHSRTKTGGEIIIRSTKLRKLIGSRVKIAVHVAEYRDYMLVELT